MALLFFLRARMSSVKRVPTCLDFIGKVFFFFFFPVRIRHQHLQSWSGCNTQTRRKLHQKNINDPDLISTRLQVTPGVFPGVVDMLRFPWVNELRSWIVSFLAAFITGSLKIHQMPFVLAGQLFLFGADCPSKPEQWLQTFTWTVAISSGICYIYKYELTTIPQIGSQWRGGHASAAGTNQGRVITRLDLHTP